MIPPYGTAPGNFPEHFCQTDYGEAYKETGGWGMGLSTTGDSDIGGRV